MLEDDFVIEDGHWRYEGLQSLEEGDDFTVFAEMEAFFGLASFIAIRQPGAFRVR